MDTLNKNFLLDFKLTTIFGNNFRQPALLAHQNQVNQIFDSKQSFLT